MSFPILADSDLPVSIQADRFSYLENGRAMLASGNVQLRDDRYVLYTDSLWFDSVTERASGTGNVRVANPSFTGKAASFSWDISSDVLMFRDLRLSNQSERGGKSVFYTFHSAQVSPNFLFGQGGDLTSCEDVFPHYKLSAGQFMFRPGSFLEGTHVLYSSTWWGIVPVYLWIPYYRYSFERRSILWNIPVIGKKDSPGWGWFVQNTIDYDWVDGRDSSVFLDWFEHKGVGFGIRHQYHWEPHSSELSYYFLNEQDTGIYNYKLSIMDQFSLGNQSMVTFNYQRVNAERLDSTGRQLSELKKISLVQPDHLARTEWFFSDYQDDLLRYRESRIGVSRQKLLATEYSFLLSNRDNQVLFQKDLTGDLFHRLEFSKNSVLLSQFGYVSREVFAKPTTSFLKTSLDYEQQVLPRFKFNFRVNTLSDFDLNPATSNQALKQYFYKLPELVFTYTDFWDFASPTVSVTIGRYQESYLTSSQFYRVYPAPQDFGVAPNTLIYDQKLSRSYGKSSQDGQFYWSFGYTQYAFFEQTKPVFSGDAMYFLSVNSSYLRRWGWFESQTQYMSLIAPSTNNSPFFKFSDKILSSQVLSEKWIFYFFEDAFQWEHSSGYDWVARRYQDYQTFLTLMPDPYWKTKVSAGKKLSVTDLEQHYDYLPFTIDSRWIKDRTQFLFSIGFDPNDWIYRDRTIVLYSSLVVGFPLFFLEKKESQWHFEMTYLYNTVNQPSGFDVRRYELQIFELVNQDHCQTFSFGYNKVKEELTFRYTLDLFPEDPLELISNSSSVRFGGRLQSKSEERF